MSFKCSLVFSFLGLSVIFALDLSAFFRSVFFVSLAVILLSLIFSSAAVSSDFSSLLFELSFFTRGVFFVVLLLDSVPLALLSAFIFVFSFSAFLFAGEAAVTLFSSLFLSYFLLVFSQNPQLEVFPSPPYHLCCHRSLFSTSQLRALIVAIIDVIIVVTVIIPAVVIVTAAAIMTVIITVIFYVITANTAIRAVIIAVVITRITITAPIFFCSGSVVS
ncbi:MAG: hypothetical protein ACLTER_07375 [Ruminococcus sp.]